MAWRWRRIQADLLGRVLLRILSNTEDTKVLLAELKAKVEAEKSVIDSAVTLIAGLAQKLREALATGDPAAVQAIADELDAEIKPLADAVAANSPAAP